MLCDYIAMDFGKGGQPNECVCTNNLTIVYNEMWCENKQQQQQQYFIGTKWDKLANKLKTKRKILMMMLNERSWGLFTIKLVD